MIDVVEIPLSILLDIAYLPNYNEELPGGSKFIVCPLCEQSSHPKNNVHHDKECPKIAIRKILKEKGFIS